MAQALIKHVINLFTAAEVILFDNGTEFRKNLFAELCSAFNIQHSFIVAHQPASNGQCERANRKNLEALRHVTGRLSHSWDEWTSHIAVSIISPYSTGINESPYFVLFLTDKRLL